MGVTVVLPPSDMAAGAIARVCAVVQERIGAFRLVAPAESRESFARLLGRPVDRFALDEPSSLAADDTVVFVRNNHASRWGDDWVAPRGQRVYHGMADGELRLVGDLDDREWPHRGMHVFNRLAPPRGDCFFYYFPYGFLLCRPGMGPLNEFGFRIPVDLAALANRPPNHKVVAVFGGSAVWGWYCLPHETFPAQLEAQLIDALAVAEPGWTITVLNFGQPSAVVVHQLLNYLLFCDTLEPDCVISHDGYNDLLLGMITDGRLLRENNLTYDWRLESWAQAIHGTGDVTPTQPREVLDPINPPPDVLSAYVTRKLQFHRYVESSGIPFVWGMQPILQHKRSPAEAELAGVEEQTWHGFRRCLARIPFLYEQYDRFVRLPSRVSRLVDVPGYFARFGDESVLFGDGVHLLPEGERKVADCYVTPVLEALGARTGVPVVKPAS